MQIIEINLHYVLYLLLVLFYLLPVVLYHWIYCCNHLYSHYSLCRRPLVAWFSHDQFNCPIQESKQSKKKSHIKCIIRILILETMSTSCNQRVNCNPPPPKQKKKEKPLLPVWCSHTWIINFPMKGGWFYFLVLIVNYNYTWDSTISWLWSSVYAHKANKRCFHTNVHP